MVLEYIQCPAIILPFISLMPVMWFVSHRQEFNLILARLAAARTSAPTPSLMLVCLFVCVSVCLCLSVCFSCLFSSFLISFVSLFMHTCHPQQLRRNVYPPKKESSLGCSPAKALEGRVCSCGTTEKYLLLWCDVHNFKTERGVRARNMSLERGWKRHKARGMRGRSKGNKVRGCEGDSFVCVLLCV